MDVAPALAEGAVGVELAVAAEKAAASKAEASVGCVASRMWM